MRKHLLSFLALMLALLTAPAWANDHRRARAAPDPRYVQECGSCHVAYPARMLPAASWQRLMRDLPRHFGNDASLDLALAQAISNWLIANADEPRRAGDIPPQDRLTLSPWFKREHKEIRAATWTHPDIKSAANCAACHPRAEQGDFDEHQVRIPR